jgi:multiple sugar transport system ATP-binding protein
VALGRAIVREPKAFLLDEPLSNLDAKMRSQMRTEINKMHKDLQTTFIYVTHDQVEAMTMGTLIVVMKDGVIQQTDNPYNLYENPVNKFVAGFIGTPQMNFIDAEIIKEDKKTLIKFCGNTLALPEEISEKIPENYLNKEITLGIRAEDMKTEKDYIDKNPGSTIEGVLNVIEQLGNETLLYITVEGRKEDLVLRTNEKKLFELNRKIKLAVDLKRIKLFDKATEENILR